MTKDEKIENITLVTRPLIELPVGTQIAKQRKKTKFIDLITPFVASNDAVFLDQLKEVMSVGVQTLKVYCREEEIKMKIRADSDGKLWAVFTRR